jgi:DNA-binding winged helix-turn-helix (wHTH) protein/tetratricopeptide (TPR) repeat protein
MTDGLLPGPAVVGLATRPAIELAGLRLEPSTLSLQGPQSRVTVEPRVMQLLVALVDAGGAVASRESLLASCWAGLVVGDDALHRAVAGARRALRDAGASELAIETIPRVGYRLVATAVPPGQPEPDPAAVGGSPAPVPAEATPPHPAVLPAQASAGGPAAPRRRAWVIAAAATLGLGAVIAWQRRRSAALAPEVSELLAQGQRALRQAQPEGDRQAAKCFEQATLLAPRHAPAWGLLSAARQQLSVAAPSGSLMEALSAVEVAASRALALDPDQPDALTARALLVPAFGEWSQVTRALQAVLDRHPEHLPTLDALATLMSSTGLVAAHYPLRLKTVELDHFHAGYNFRSIYSHWMNGQVVAADRAGERGLELWPRHLPTWLARHSLFKYTARVVRAQAMLDDADAALPLQPWLRETLKLSARALATGLAADRSAARDRLLGSLDGGGPLAAIGATLDLAALGETALALDVTEAFLLERGPLIAGTAWRPGQAVHLDVRHRFTNHLFLPVSAALRAQPRFTAILRDVGMVNHWSRTGRQPEYLSTQPGAGDKPAGVK